MATIVSLTPARAHVSLYFAPKDRSHLDAAMREYRANGGTVARIPRGVCTYAASEVRELTERAARGQRRAEITEAVTARYEGAAARFKRIPA